LFEGDEDDEDDLGPFDPYMDMMLEEAREALAASSWRKLGLLLGDDGSFDAYSAADTDADWIPDMRDDNGMNASTSTLLAVRATNRSTSDDVEGEAKDLMMMVMIEENE
jgi:hypothetical protein